MLSLVIPTFNCKDSINSLLSSLSSALVGVSHELLVVDDDSSDGTALEALNFRSINPSVKVFVRRKDKGFSSAVLSGFSKASGDLLGVVRPGVDVRVLPDLLKSGADFCVASRFFTGLSDRFFSLLSKKLFGLSDFTDFFVVKRGVFDDVKNSLSLAGDSFLFDFFRAVKPVSVSEVFFLSNGAKFPINFFKKVF